MNLDYWFMFPTAILIATIAIASGVEGATFFTPVFLLGLKLPADVAIGTGIITEVFGFSSGLWAYFRKGLIDFKLGQQLLWVSIPFVLIGTGLSKVIPGGILKLMLALGLIVIAISFLKPKHQQFKVTHEPVIANRGTTLIDRQGHSYHYPPVNLPFGRLLISIGALFLGMISTGLGQLNGYFLLQRSQIPSPVAVATSVFVVAVTALVGSVGHVLGFIEAGGETVQQVINIVIFTAPGVVIGGQVGSWLAVRLPQKLLERGMGLLFVAIAALIFFELAQSS